MNRYLEMTDRLKNRGEWLKNGKLHCLLVVIISVTFNFTRWFEFETVFEKVDDETSFNETVKGNVTLQV